MRQWAQLERSQEIMDTILVVTVDNGGHRRQGTLSQEAIDTILGVTARDNGHSNRHNLRGHSYKQWTQCWPQETMDTMLVVTGDNWHNMTHEWSQKTKDTIFVFTEDNEPNASGHSRQRTLHLVDNEHNASGHRRQWTQLGWSQEKLQTLLKCLSFTTWH